MTRARLAIQIGLLHSLQRLVEKSLCCYAPSGCLFGKSQAASPFDGCTARQVRNARAKCVLPLEHRNLLAFLCNCLKRTNFVVARMCYEFLDRGQVRVSRHVAGFRSRQAEHTEAASQRSEECRRSPTMPLADACLARWVIVFHKSSQPCQVEELHEGPFQRREAPSS